MSPTNLRSAHAALAIKRVMQVRREEYLDHMTFRANQRPLLTEIYGPMPGVKEAWAAEGATPEELDLSAFRYRCALDGPIPVTTGWLGGQEEETLEETADYIVARDRMGRRLKLCKGYATLPLPLDYPVQDMDDWRRLRKHYEFCEARLTPGWKEVAREHRQAGRVVTVSIPGAFYECRELLGDAALCMAYHTQPALIHDMLETFAETACRVLERVSAAVPIDQVHVPEDMAGKGGPLIGPQQVEAFVKPYYRRVWDLLHSRGARLFMVESDGNLEPIIPALLEAGVNMLRPNEPAAGMDIVRLRARYGSQLAFMGGIDKHVLRRSREEITAELEYKVPPMVRTGGCVLGLDHRITDGTPLESYRFYIEKAWEILERESAGLTKGE